MPSKSLPPISRTEVRGIISKVLLTDADFEAFCIDFFPSVHERFTAGMERVAKINLLLSLVSTDQLFEALHRTTNRSDFESLFVRAKSSVNAPDQLEGTSSDPPSYGKLSSPPMVWCSYSPRDQSLFDEFAAHFAALVHNGSVHFVGASIHDAHTNFEIIAARVIIFLLSRDYLSDKRGVERIALALENYKDVPIFTVLLNPVVPNATLLVTVAPPLLNGVPITACKDRDVAWLEVIQKVMDAIALDSHPAESRSVPKVKPPLVTDKPIPTSDRGAMAKKQHPPQVEPLPDSSAASPFNPIIFAVLVVLLLIMVVVVILLGKVMASSVLVLILGIGTFALLVTAVTAWLGTSAGVFRTPQGKLVGSSAVFAIIFSLGIGSTKIVDSVVRDTWTLTGEVEGIPRGKTAQLLVGDCTPTTVDPNNGQFRVQIHPHCDRDPLDLVIQVTDYAQHRESISREKAKNWVRLSFEIKLVGRVLSADGQFLPHVFIKPDRCPDGKGVFTDEQGEFVIVWPLSCRLLPYHLMVNQQGRPVTWEGNDPLGITIKLPVDPQKPKGLSNDFSKLKAKIQMPTAEPRPLIREFRELSGLPVLVVTSGEKLNAVTDYPAITREWNGPVTHLARAKREDFIRALGQNPSIVHIEADVGSNYIEFEDGRISATLLRDLFAAHSRNVKLVILSSCQSFQVGKALEHSGVEASLVAMSNLGVQGARTFYEKFYHLLANGVSLSESYSRAMADNGASSGVHLKEVFELSIYGSRPRSSPGPR